MSWGKDRLQKQKVIGLEKASPSMKEMARMVLGDDIEFMVIPKDHDVFHSVFDVEVTDLNGAFNEGRLFLIYSMKRFGANWVSRSPFSLQVGINMIVYALNTGGIAQQLIDDSTQPVQNSHQWWDYK